MAIVVGFDVNIARTTVAPLDAVTGEVHCGRIPAAPESVRGWAVRFAGERVEVVVEACTALVKGLCVRR